ncbi:MAG: SET domain-containing protein-lysine N-methyltransferase [archaeon]
MKKYPTEPWLSPKVEIRNSLIQGKGSFAKEKINKGETVFIWGAHFINKKEAEAEKAKGRLIMQFDEDLFTAETRGDDPTYYMNHSCGPNVWMKDAVTLIARKGIAKGEELTGDYAMWDYDEEKIKQWECKCGTKYCRHKLTGKDWRLTELQKRYKGHFSPLINKRIMALKKTD